MKIVTSGKIYIILCICAISITSCRQNEKKAKTQDHEKSKAIKDWNKTIPGNFSAEHNWFLDSVEIETFLIKYPLFKDHAPSIREFYTGRNHAYAWYADKRLIEQAGNLADRIKNLKNEGISKDIPYRNTLDSLLYAKGTGKPDLQLELMLTANYFAFAKLAWEGMDTSISKSSQWFLPRKKLSYAAYLDSMIKVPQKVSKAEAPVYRQYDLLKKHLLQYRDLQNQNSWKPITGPAKSYKPGDSATLIAEVKKRLFKLGDFKGDTLNNHYNEELEAATKQFQTRHGLTADGAIGRGTLSEMNVPLATRIRQILVNMERSRWLPVHMDSVYLGVNIPEFKLHAYRADSLLWSSNVVVGQSVHRTVIFSGDIKYVVFNPYWNVPESIVRKEIMPAMRQNPDYINAHKMEITGYKDGIPIVRQKPGPQNSLGLVKFLFPNSYNIYLHDSPAKSLFNESSRAFSHGCIRVANPFKLATFLLNYDNWNEQKIEGVIQSGKEQYITLKHKVPVFIAYFTAFTDRNNLLNFRKDIYARDEALAKMLIQD
ncbi:murein L,D-transpeptidase [Pedobacter heparinus]|uniref:L,D-transpeptidase family protein n=1 Tax=Pedobacter heparinus TaxID=984 RepID=UPI002931EC50|nr:L,D-transpeptidase family protein [Pedobacter heparinus]